MLNNLHSLKPIDFFNLLSLQASTVFAVGALAGKVRAGDARLHSIQFIIKLIIGVKS
jgi:hypothetical protein